MACFVGLMVLREYFQDHAVLLKRRRFLRILNAIPPSIHLFSLVFVLVLFLRVRLTFRFFHWSSAAKKKPKKMSSKKTLPVQ